MIHIVRLLITMAILNILVVISPDPALAKSAEEIDAESNQALETLYTQSPAAKELGVKARGILIFPSITKDGLIVGGEYGEGALRVDGKTQGYHSSASGSVGLQFGISSRSLVIMFMTDGALKDFTSADGWEAGVNADVTVVDVGATGSLDITTAQKSGRYRSDARYQVGATALVLDRSLLHHFRPFRGNVHPYQESPTGPDATGPADRKIPQEGRRRSELLGCSWRSAVS